MSVEQDDNVPSRNYVSPALREYIRVHFDGGEPRERNVPYDSQPIPQRMQDEISAMMQEWRERQKQERKFFITAFCCVALVAISVALYYLMSFGTGEL